MQSTNGVWQSGGRIRWGDDQGEKAPPVSGGRPNMPAGPGEHEDLTSSVGLDLVGLYTEPVCDYPQRVPVRLLHFIPFDTSDGLRRQRAEVAS